MAMDDNVTREALLKQAQNVTSEDLGKVVKNEEKLRSKFESAGPLTRFLDDFFTFISLIKDFMSGKYKEIPFLTIAAIVGALLYVLNPIDIIPDFIPGLGLVDDGLVMAACVAMVEQDLKSYKGWKEKGCKVR